MYLRQKRAPWSRSRTKTFGTVRAEPLVLLEICEYKEGVISMERDEQIYEFVAIDKKTIYDVQTKELLIRRGDG